MTGQRRYVEAFVRAVAETLTADPDAAREAVMDQMRALVTDQRLAFLAELSVEPVRATLRGAGR